MRTTLVIMAAGIGSRFGGGIKQLMPVDPQGHIIMDYSIHDAIEAGFGKIVFIIRRDIEEDFKEIIGNRIEKTCAKHNVAVAYCFQDLRNIPGELPEGRTKPWGTGQAVLAADGLIEGPFAVINADDYYGKEAYVALNNWLTKAHGDREIVMAGFILKNTLSDNGGVTRGICTVDEHQTRLVSITETSNIVKTAYGAEADGTALDPDSYVSMNMWGFPAAERTEPAFMQVLREGFVTFFRDSVPANPLKAEYLLPTLIGQLLKRDACSVEVRPTHDKWFGVTYAEDKPSVIAAFGKLIKDGVYSEDLYSDL